MKKYCSIIILSIICIMHPSVGQDLSASTRGLQIAVSTQEGASIDLYDESYALIVGNGKYTNGWDPLPGAVKDVNEVASALEKNGFNVDLNFDLTRDEFNIKFAEFVVKYGRNKNNRLLFYYAGHGFTHKMVNAEELGYLVMVDAPAPEKDPVGFSLKSVKMQSLVTDAKMIQAKHVLFIFDSCFSGTVLNFRDRIVPNTISDNVKLPVRQFITAGRANESVPDYSVFKQCFLDILEGRDEEPIKDGYLTGEELGLYLKTKVPSYNKFQHPQYGKIKDPKLDKGDFVFLLEHKEKVKISKIPLPVKDSKKYQIASIAPAQINNVISLRSTYNVILEELEVKSFVTKYNFFDNVLNPNGKYKSRRIDNKDGTITDVSTSLMWQKNGSPKKLSMRWALRYVEELNKKRFAGYSDWRLPSIEELSSLMEKDSKRDTQIDPLFSSKQKRCWSGDGARPVHDYRGMKGAWIANFTVGSIQNASWFPHHVTGALMKYELNQENYAKAVRSDR